MVDADEWANDLAFQMEIIDDDGDSKLRVQLGQNSTTLSPHEVDEIIELLGLTRADMEPEVPLEVARNHQFPLETQPAWKVIVDQNFHGAVLFFRHSGYGWTGFAIPYESLTKILDLDLCLTLPVTRYRLN
ncbi:hypothetical protein [Paraburkholderia bannensis]|uniref:hypothetical protein n=1 Tax=Paraburkholderia bannensis TaxID=765414 RepID=UPI00069444EF|nr:hypothetical protein [Paraburkholderia bannensis]